MTPESARHLAKLGHKCVIEAGAGKAAGFPDEDYKKAGAEIARGKAALWKAADIIIKVRPPTAQEIKGLGQGKTLVSLFFPAQNPKLLKAAAATKATVIAMDMVPRISRAQKLDALSSMANLAGYRAVIEAGNSFGKLFGGQVTAAGKIPPAKVLVIGAGVAGLSAIGTARSLGAIVRAFDVRPEVAEQIESMGAEFLMLDFDESQNSAESGGYAKPSSPEFRKKQIERFREQAPEIDIVITTALIPGQKAPRVWLKDMVAAMRPGSVIVDLAAEQGGNCELTKPGEAYTTPGGVAILGHTDYPSRMAQQSSALYASNVRHMIAEMTPERDGKIKHDMENDIIRSCAVARQGKVTYPPPPLRTKAIAPPPAARKTPPEEAARQERASFRKATARQAAMLAALAIALVGIGQYAPASLMQHLTVFALACFVGYQVIWNVSHALHTPLMAVTNAISGIIVVGALLQLESQSWLVAALAAVSVLIASINIFGGFLVTRRMLAMFRKS